MRSTRFSRHLAVALFVVPTALFGVSGCRTGSEGKATSDPAANAGAEKAASAAANVRTFGTPITATEAVTLEALEKSPTSYKGKTIVTSGTITAVCQERGCWMELSDDDDHDANVRMHGHSFFIPKDSAGKRARVQATVVLVKDGKSCEEMEATGASLELDATGVEIL